MCCEFEPYIIYKWYPLQIKGPYFLRQLFLLISDKVSPTQNYILKAERAVQLKMGSKIINLSTEAHMQSVESWSIHFTQGIKHREHMKAH